MDVYKTISNFGRYASLLTFVILVLSSSVFATSPIITTLNSLCTQIVAILGVAMIFLVLLSALVYAIGQVLGAETRARATVWATAMFTGAIMGAIIYIVLPVVVRGLVGTPPTGVPAIAAPACT